MTEDAGHGKAKIDWFSDKFPKQNYDFLWFFAKNNPIISQLNPDMNHLLQVENGFICSHYFKG